MLKQTLISINNNLEKLIKITANDIQDIKDANHDNIFERNQKKDKLIQEFIAQKNKIDMTLLKRSESGLSIENILNPEEDKLFTQFKIQLKEFHNIHKRFSKMVLLVANFYNNLTNKVNQAEVDIGYEMKQKYSSNFSLKG